MLVFRRKEVADFQNLNVMVFASMLYQSDLGGHPIKEIVVIDPLSLIGERLAAKWDAFKVAFHDLVNGSDVFVEDEFQCHRGLGVPGNHIVVFRECHDAVRVPDAAIQNAFEAFESPLKIVEMDAGKINRFAHIEMIIVKKCSKSSGRAWHICVYAL